ncbi:MAG: hypothetical protein GY899_11660 [Verrucomicrobiaceae bacterium]|nr:hypothetical protein [Verrucomicrobiaceae bacterium]
MRTRESMLMRMFSEFFRQLFLYGLYILLASLMTGCFYTLQRPLILKKVDRSPGFERDIRAMMQKFCFDCHGAKHREAGLDLRTLRAILSGGESGPAIVPGIAEESILFEMVSDGHMPPEGKRPGAYQIRRLRQWIVSGAQP